MKTKKLIYILLLFLLIIIDVILLLEQTSGLVLISGFTTGLVLGLILFADFDEL